MYDIRSMLLSFILPGQIINYFPAKIMQHNFQCITYEILVTHLTSLKLNILYVIKNLDFYKFSEMSTSILSLMSYKLMIYSWLANMICKPALTFKFNSRIKWLCLPITLLVRLFLFFFFLLHVMIFILNLVIVVLLVSCKIVTLTLK